MVVLHEQELIGRATNELLLMEDMAEVGVR